jgi:tetratricopeptide (TPR) repeat protein
MGYAMRKRLPLIVLLALALCLCGVIVYFLPPVHDRLSWRLEEANLRLQYALHPPARQVFVPLPSPTPANGIKQDPANTALPQSGEQIAAITPNSPPAALVSPTVETTGTVTTTLDAAVPPTLDTPGAGSMPSTPTATLMPLPGKVDLKGVRYDDQHGRLNYCAPANLSMALSFWGWQGNKDVVGPVLKPDARDKNVMPYEMVDYVNEHTDLKVAYRVGGDLDLLKRFLAAGYPVLAEKGNYSLDISGVVSWMGHYMVLTGYDDAEGYIIGQDSLLGPDKHIGYDKIVAEWRAFNYTYLIIYPPDKEAEVMGMLGIDADETTNYQNAATRASNEIYGLSGIDQYFAWFNRGTNLVKLQDYMGAVAAYEEAFKIYPTIPENERPWRMLWYQTGPYFAYYGAQDYYNLLYLADGTLNAMQSEKNLEESYYWRGMARLALGDTAAAIEDFHLALKYHPDFPPALAQLQALGVTP